MQSASIYAPLKLWFSIRLLNHGEKVKNHELPRLQVVCGNAVCLVVLQSRRRLVTSEALTLQMAVLEDASGSGFITLFIRHLSSIFLQV